MENKEKNETQSRRDFFKEAAKKALPILGAVALISNPVIAKAVEGEPMGCSYGGCEYTCQGGCMGCTGACTGGCKETCTYNCAYTCTGSCSLGCTGCSGYCRNSSAGSF